MAGGRTTTEPTNDRNLARDPSRRTEACFRPRSNGRPSEGWSLLVRACRLQSKSGAHGRWGHRYAGGPAEVFEMGRIDREVHRRAAARSEAQAKRRQHVRVARFRG